MLPWLAQRPYVFQDIVLECSVVASFPPAQKKIILGLLHLTHFLLLLRGPLVSRKIELTGIQRNAPLGKGAWECYAWVVQFGKAGASAMTGRKRGSIEFAKAFRLT